jgi:hypothetical protein
MWDLHVRYKDVNLRLVEELIKDASIGLAHGVNRAAGL